VNRENGLERALIIGLLLPYVERWEVEDSLDELGLLADTAGAQVVDRIVQNRNRVDPTFYIGRGKAEALAILCQELDIDLVIFDADLSTAQHRNLEKTIKTKIVDRSGLILDIFARRARTKEAKTQVELAQLQYLLPRLPRQWPHLSRQVGGIGTRGPGETQLEVDRRRVRRRISVLARTLSEIEKERKVQRKSRKGMFRTVLVGYTNSGKSTLLNNLSRASHAFVEDRLFATLDSLTRVMELPPNHRVLVTDTVGFIRKLPHHLIASFHGTLDEVREADLLLHVVDVSHPNFEEQILIVERTLVELEAADKPILKVLNKVDKVNGGFLRRIRQKYRGGIPTSALNGWGINELRSAIAGYVRREYITLELEIPQREARLLSRIRNRGEMLEEEYRGDEVLLKVQLRKIDAEKMGLVERNVER